jgi:hypothetical protein
MQRIYTIRQDIILCQLSPTGNSLTSISCHQIPHVLQLAVSEKCHKTKEISGNTAVLHKVWQGSESNVKDVPEAPEQMARPLE